MESFYAVVVMYNREITESRSCTNIEKITNHKINMIVVDNSTRRNNNEKFCQEKKWIYISLNGNRGLSKAYNCVLDYLKDEKGIIIWFDDDTDVTQEYFDELDKDVEQYKLCSIFAPVIQGQDGKFWSPNEARFFRNKQIKSINQSIPNEKFNAINSCTAVRLDVYKNYRYSEKLFLDQVDHNFFEDQRKLGCKFKKMNVVIHHNFSTKSIMKSIDNVMERYKIMIPDFLTYCSKSNSKYFLGLVKVAGWGVREGIRYKDLSFFFWTLKEAFQWKKSK